MPLGKEGFINLFQVVDNDGNPARVSAFAGVYRLAVEAIIGGGGIIVTDTDDNSIAVGQTLPLIIDENYIFDGTTWIRQQGGVDNAVAPASPQGQFVGGVVTSPLGAYANGDVSLLHFDTTGRLLVDAEGVTDTDDNAVPPGQITGLCIDLNYVFDGTNWVRQHGGVDNAVAPASPQTAFVGGTVTSPVGVFADGDISLLHFDTSGRLLTAASGGATVTDTDDDSITSGQVLPLEIEENYFFDGTNWRRGQSRAVSAAISESLMYALTRAAITGFDSSAAVGSQNVPIAARNADVIGDFDFTLVGELTNSRLALLDISTSNWDRWRMDQLSVIEGAGRAPASIFGGWCLGVNFGRDTTGASVYRPIEGRNLDANADVAAALVALLTNSRINALGAADYERLSGRSAATDANFLDTLFGLTTNTRVGVFDERTAAYARLRGITVNATTGGVESAMVMQSRESALADTIVGRRFTAVHQTIGTVVLGQTAFDATTPTFMLRLAAAANKVIFRSITLSQASPVAGAFITIAVVLDTADRFSAGGTLVTPQNLNEESATAAVATFRFNPTATAAGGGTRVIMTTTSPASVGTVTQIDFKDGIFMGITSTLLVYTFAATTGPSWNFTFEWSEVIA